MGEDTTCTGHLSKVDQQEITNLAKAVKLGTTSNWFLVKLPPLCNGEEEEGGCYFKLGTGNTVQSIFSSLHPTAHISLQDIVKNARHSYKDALQLQQHTHSLQHTTSKQSNNKNKQLTLCLSLVLLALGG